MTPAVLRDRRFVVAAVSVLVVYLLTLAISPKRVFWTPDEGAKWLEMHSIEVRGDLRYFVDFPSQRVDDEFRYLPHFGIYPRPSIAPDGSLYLAFETPVIFPLLSSVGFYLFGIVGIFILPLVSGWVAALVAGALAAAIRPGAGALVVLLVGLATPIWFYSVLFWEHTLATCIGMLAVAVVAVSPPWSVASLLAAVFAFLGAATLRMEILALGGAVVIAWVVSGFVVRGERRSTAVEWPWVRSRPARWAVSFALLIIAAGAAAFLQAALTLRHYKLLEQLPQRLQTGIEALTASPWSILDVFVHTSISEAPPASDAWVLAAGVGIALCLIAAFVRNVRLESALLLPGLGLLLAFSVSLLIVPEVYRALHGFIPVAPFVVLAPYAYGRSDHHARSYTLVFLSILAAVYPLAAMLGISTIYLEVGRLAVGIEWGQRYLLTLYVIAAVLSVVGVQAYWYSIRPLWMRRTFVAAFTLLVATAVAFQIRGNEMLYSTRVRLASWEDAMRKQGPLVTTVWWLPASFAVLFTEHEMYYVIRREDVADWAVKAASRGIREFTFVTFEPVSVANFGTERVRLAPRQPQPVEGLHLVRFVLQPADESTPQSGR